LEVKKRPLHRRTPEKNESLRFSTNGSIWQSRLSSTFALIWRQTLLFPAFIELMDAFDVAGLATISRRAGNEKRSEFLRIRLQESAKVEL